ncbi:putative spermidine synthase [Paramyrothecium foliicola]|nr:putative spermidine synthase [Paramyrothecium foliicola]
MAGQAMTLKVEKVLHHEKSQYQDVLIFKSTDYGTVLVLDNVIQATERDEFSYQEMIAHLALNSHPNPKKVLVIGGGDGGVLREVVKHDCVEEAILCDIDEAVIRLSKQYLPDMAQGLTHAKSTVHVGDGFKFLDEYKNAFDVIITDSSDPDGPAESLFQKSYFQLLHDALREGGVITTQGCMSPFFLRKVKGSLGPVIGEAPFFCLRRPEDLRSSTGTFRAFRSWGLPGASAAFPKLLPWRESPFVSSIYVAGTGDADYFIAENQWLHLSLITRLKKDCKEVFPVAEYAYTTIPTYPSGQIGFMVCCKDPNRDVKVPVRSWTPEEEEAKCRYYNAEIHKASFILPTFAKKALQ